MNDADYFKIFGPLSFRAADKFFRFTSWAIVISVIRYAEETTGSSVLGYLGDAATAAFSLALLMQALYIFVRDPTDWGIPPHLIIVSRVIQIVVGGLLLFLCTAPFLVLDTIIADLQNAKPHEIIAKPQ